MEWTQENNEPRSAVQIAWIVVGNMIYWMILLAAIGFGALYLGQCPVQPNIPIYLIVLGVSNIVVLILLYIMPTCSNGINVPLTKGCVALLYFFIFCWFIIGTHWIYTVYPPSYSPGTTRYCHKTAYQFAFVITTAQWVAIALFFIFAVCLALLTCCAGVKIGRRLIPSRRSFYGATGDYREPVVGDVP